MAAERGDSGGERTFERLHEPHLALLVRSFGAKLGAQIRDQHLDLAAAQADAEEFADQIGQLMGFIQNHGIDARQQIAEAIFLERQVGEQQMMIDHNDVGFERVAARLEHSAAIEVRAARAQAILARGADVRPQRVRIAQLRQFRQITAASCQRPLADAGQQRVGLHRQQIALPSDVRRGARGRDSCCGP